ncbi:uncharacterized protein LOC142520312 [Primulina tabacum]|uniref:uncharacterized protein LOC142520312 n=1 Tax=Primulina tabacum TaxID=48773 RepID=UPI003F596C30
MVNINNVPDDIIRLRLFSFSLTDQARGWLQSLPLGSITIWQELATKFLAKYFPPRNLHNWVQIELFYNGLNGQTRGTLDAAAGGMIFAKSPYQAYDLLEKMTINSYQWPCERWGVKRTTGVYTVDPITSLTAQVSTLTTHIAAMNKVSTSDTKGPSVVVEESHFPEEENNKNVLSPPPGFNASNEEAKPSFEDLVGIFVAESGKKMARTESRLDNLETHMANIGASLKILESQVGQIMRKLTSQPSGAIPKTADPNLREVNAVFIQHEEIGMVDREVEKVDLTPSEMISHHQEKEPEVRKSTDLKEVELTEGSDEGIQRKLPQKLQDLEEFVVPCAIGGQMAEKDICDSGASLADKSVKVPLGFVEDVEVQIDKLRLPADFVVLNMKNSQNVHVIIGRPFLATTGAVIDAKRGNLTMEFEGQRVEIKASKRSHEPP